MKHLVLLFGLIIFFASSVPATYACSCGKITVTIVINDEAPKPDAEEIKRWRLEQNDVAFFIGQVIKIEKVKMKNSENSDERSPMKKVTVRVEKYWLGVKSPEMIIYTGVGGGDCGVPYEKGKEYFFWASRARVSGLLETGICSPTRVSDQLIKDFNEVFGDAKTK
jgi:hypothetical protein